ncbi:MAG: hypothetical protein ABIJ97_01270 [Bacteroidota bacterium]
MRNISYGLINVYGVMGYSYYNIKKFDEALKAFNNAINESSEDGELYYWRGITKLNLEMKNEGCIDLSKAGEYGIEDAYEIISKYCN